MISFSGDSLDQFFKYFVHLSVGKATKVINEKKYWCYGRFSDYFFTTYGCYHHCSYHTMSYNFMLFMATIIDVILLLIFVKQILPSSNGS